MFSETLTELMADQVIMHVFSLMLELNFLKVDRICQVPDHDNDFSFTVNCHFSFSNPNDSVRLLLF